VSDYGSPPTTVFKELIKKMPGKWMLYVILYQDLSLCVASFYYHSIKLSLLIKNLKERFIKEIFLYEDTLDKPLI